MLLDRFQTNNSPDRELESARKRAAISALLNLGLALGKGYVGLKAGSTALLSDAIHSATDVLASTAAYIGLWVAGRRHPSFPYGLYKAETIATLVSSIAVILAGYEIGRRAVFGPESIPDVRIALPVAVISLLVSLFFGLIQVRAGERLTSPALIADGKDYLADSLSTAVVILGLVGTWFGYKIDRWAAVIVSFFVFRSGGLLLLSALRDLLDVSVDRQVERAIIALVERHPAVNRVEKIMSRRAGGRFIVDLDVVLRTPSHEVADKVSDSLEHEITRRFPRVVMARVRPHFHPTPEIRIITPVTDPQGHIADHLAKAPWFLVETFDRTSGALTHKELVENPYRNVEKKRGYLVGSWLLSLKPDKVIVAKVREGTADALLKGAGVTVEEVDEERFRHAGAEDKEGD